MPSPFRGRTLRPGPVRPAAPAAGAGAAVEGGFRAPGMSVLPPPSELGRQPRSPCESGLAPPAALSGVLYEADIPASTWSTASVPQTAGGSTSHILGYLETQCLWGVSPGGAVTVDVSRLPGGCSLGPVRCQWALSTRRGKGRARVGSSGGRALPIGAVILRAVLGGLR